MNYHRICSVLTALAALGFTAATTTSAEAFMCWTDTGTCPWW